MSLALPFLEIMAPAISHAKAKASKPSPVRLCVLYKGCGVNPHSWDIVGGTIFAPVNWETVLKLPIIYQ